MRYRRETLARPGLLQLRAPVLDEHDPNGLTGRTVAIVGTDSTATQIVPEIAPIVKQLYLFQREPGWVTPKGDRDFTRAERAKWRNPIRHRWVRAKGFLDIERTSWRGRFWKPGTKINTQGRAACLAFIDEVFADRPDLKAAVTPSYAYPGKRPIFNSTFYPALKLDNVELVPRAVARITSPSPHPARLPAAARTQSRSPRQQSSRGSS